jgi:hypothetical protein
MLSFLLLKDILNTFAFCNQNPFLHTKFIINYYKQYFELPFQCQEDHTATTLFATVSKEMRMNNQQVIKRSK